MRDWHAERYAAGEALAKAAREALNLLEPGLFATARQTEARLELHRSIAEYERTKNAP